MKTKEQTEFSNVPECLLLDSDSETAVGSRVTIWTDGSAWPNPGPGGWACVIEDEFGTRIELSGRSKETTTNNRMEIQAAIEALRFLKEPSQVKIVSDSRYLQGGASRCAYCISERVVWLYGIPPEPWKLNRDLWYQLMEAMKAHRIHWEWIKSHQNWGNGNDRADYLAERARTGDEL